MAEPTEGLVIATDDDASLIAAATLATQYPGSLSLWTRAVERELHRRSFDQTMNAKPATDPTGFAADGGEIGELARAIERSTFGSVEIGRFATKADEQNAAKLDAIKSILHRWWQAPTEIRKRVAEVLDAKEVDS